MLLNFKEECKVCKCFWISKKNVKFVNAFEFQRRIQMHLDFKEEYKCIWISKKFVKLQMHLDLQIFFNLLESSLKSKSICNFLILLWNPKAFVTFLFFFEI